MGLIEWYMKVYKNIDPLIHHPSACGRRRSDFDRPKISTLIRALKKVSNA